MTTGPKLIRASATPRANSSTDRTTWGGQARHPGTDRRRVRPIDTPASATKPPAE